MGRKNSPSQSQSVVAVPLNSERESLQTLYQQERGEGVQSGAQITEDFDAELDSVGDGTEGFAEFQAYARKFMRRE